VAVTIVIATSVFGSLRLDEFIPTREVTRAASFAVSLFAAPANRGTNEWQRVCSATHTSEGLLTARHCLLNVNQLRIRSNGQGCTYRSWEMGDVLSGVSSSDRSRGDFYLAEQVGTDSRAPRLRRPKAHERVFVFSMPRSEQCKGRLIGFQVSSADECHGYLPESEVPTEINGLIGCLRPISKFTVCSGDSGSAVIGLDGGIIGIVMGSRSCLEDETVFFAPYRPTTKSS
jgi:hypothetical protein